MNLPIKILLTTVGAFICGLQVAKLWIAVQTTDVIGMILCLIILGCWVFIFKMLWEDTFRRY